MDFGSIGTALIIIVGLALFVGLFLGASGILFKVKGDEREELVEKALPGNNCGGCGYPGCQGLAKAIVEGKASVNQCNVGGAATARKIADIMGTTAEDVEPKVAFVACKAKCGDVTYDYEYYGVEDCRMLSFVPNGGPKSCNEGCLGLGTCANVCKFGAIKVVDKVAVVDRSKCTGCGACVNICPKHLISLVPVSSKYAVACSNKSKGADTMKQCKVGCVGCGLCERNCTSKACKVENANAKIDTSLCVNCGVCFEKCPRKTIEELF